jgi:hypothetical protein
MEPQQPQTEHESSQSVNDARCWPHGWRRFVTSHGRTTESVEAGSLVAVNWARDRLPALNELLTLERRHTSLGMKQARRAFLSALWASARGVTQPANGRVTLQGNSRGTARADAPRGLRVLERDGDASTAIAERMSGVACEVGRSSAPCHNDSCGRRTRRQQSELAVSDAPGRERGERFDWKVRR